MAIYQQFCRETFDETGNLTGITFDYPENFNFGYDVVDAIGETTPEKRALVWCNASGQERIFTFGDIRRLSNQAANVFLQAGIRRGDAVMVALKRHYEYWYVSIALHKIGAVMVPVTHMLTVNDLRYRMDCLRPKAVVCTCDEDIPLRMTHAAGLSDLDCRIWDVKELALAMAAAPDTLPRQDTGAGDPMVLYFTSGTTGEPKGVIHDFTYPLAHCITARHWQHAEEDGLHFTLAETGWAKASWGKLYGQWLCGSAVMVFDFDSFDPKQLTDIINKYGVTSFCAPPTVYRYLARKGIGDMPTLRHAATAGEMLDPAVSRRFTERTGLPLLEGYGQTETALLLANFHDSVPGSLGFPSPLYRVELRDEAGNVPPQGQIGEIVVCPGEGERPLGLFTGYLGDNKRYENVWRGGVYHTGDAAWQDEAGRFYFHGRFDDIIKTGGFRVGPGEIEHVLSSHPAVLECAVIGVPDPLRGQAIQAIVVPAPGFEGDRELEKALRDHANSQLAEYKWIRSIRFTQHIPKTISGKICKAALRG